MSKRKRDRRQEKLANIITNKTQQFIERKDALRLKKERSQKLIELLYINEMLK